uniref:BAAT/Acyl-CoA thioester hydrolase C-terminal domain-containing protein n=1 Tax=Hucho hucho TaxID=62062 RepID=A0A4W5MRW5_9TELE
MEVVLPKCLKVGALFAVPFSFKVCDSGLGLLSLFKSGDLALSIATFLPGIAATVCVNGCNANTMIPLHYKGTVIPPLMLDTKRVFATKSGALNVKYVINDLINQATLIPNERANGRFLFVAAEDDQNWDSCYFADQAMQQLKRHGKDNYESVFYPGAGHYLETPYMPFCPSSIHGVIGKPVSPGPTQKQRTTFGGGFRSYLEPTWQTIAT